MLRVSLLDSLEKLVWNRMSNSKDNSRSEMIEDDDERLLGDDSGDDDKSITLDVSVDTKDENESRRMFAKSKLKRLELNNDFDFVNTTWWVW